MRLHTFAKTISFLVGIALLALGVGTLVVVSLATVSPDTGRLFGYFSAICCLSAGAPLVALAFSAQVAKRLAIFAFSLYGLMMLGAAFWPPAGTQPSTGFQVAAIAFIVLLCFRVGSAFRNKYRVQGK